MFFINILLLSLVQLLNCRKLLLITFGVVALFLLLNCSMLPIIRLGITFFVV